MRNPVPRKVAANLGAVALGPIPVAKPGQAKGPKLDRLEVRDSIAVF